MVKFSIIDYKAGNLKSLSKALEYLNAEFIISNKKSEILDADGIFMPGVGAFGEAMKNLNEIHFKDILSEIKSREIPFMGICLGLQLLYTSSEEMGFYYGLDVVKGHVKRFREGIKVPQIGWNSVQPKQPNHFIFEDIPNNSYFYFVHSFYGIPEDPSNILAETTYEDTTFASMIVNRNFIASQFHPEKSGKIGIKLLSNFIKHVKR
jgi:glutamine amidotransferase